MFIPGMIQNIKVGIEELAEGRLYLKFKEQIPLVAQVRILLKVTAVAVACGIIANAVIGSFLGALFMIVGGVAAFSYFAQQYEVPKSLPGLVERAKVSLSWSEETSFGKDYKTSKIVRERFKQKKASEGLAILFNVKAVAKLFDEGNYRQALYQLMP